MRDKHFDEILKAKLEDVKFSFDESKWSTLAETLDSIDTTSVSDQIIGEKLHNHTVPYKESHWQILKGKLELEKALKEKIYWTNLAELVIIALLLLSFHQFNTNFVTPEEKHDLIASSQIHDAQSNNTEAIIPNVSQIDIVVDKNQNSNNQQKSAANIKSDQSISAGSNEIFTNETSIAASNNRSRSFISEVAPINPLTLFVQSIAVNNSFPPIDTNNSLSRDNIKFSDIELVEDINPIAYSSALVSAVPTIIENSRTEKWIGLMAGIDFNTIKTPIPLDIDVFKSPRNFLAMGLSHGLNYGVKKGKNEIIVSTNYSVKVYDPKITEEIEVAKSYYNRTHRQEKYNIIQVPTVYRRHLSSSKNFSTYAFAGLGVNVVTETEYITLDQLKRGDPRPKYARDQKAQYAQDEFHNGLFEGGHFKYNLFMTAEAGFGLQKEFNRVAVYLDTHYKRNLFESKLGPRNVKLNSLSLNIGTRYRL